MITAVSGIGIPVHGSVGPDLESGIALLVEIFAILGFDGGRVGRVFGEGNSTRCRENYRGSHKPDRAQELILDINERLTGAWSDSTRRNDVQLIAAVRTP
jgi:hypothetical protein